MITINLLSPNQKKELKIKRVYVAVKELVILLLLFTSIIAILLLASRYVLDNKMAQLIEKNTLVVQTNAAVVNKINLLNAKIDTIDKIQNNFKKWSNFLITITNLTPPNISYELIRIQFDSAALELRGVAKTRDDLTKLKDELNSLKLIKDINLPLKDLLPKDNNQFTITASININELK